MNLAEIIVGILGIGFCFLFLFLMFEDFIRDVQRYYGWKKFYKTHPNYKDNWKEHWGNYKKRGLDM